MSRLAHAALGAAGLEAEKRDQAARAQREVAQAKHIQQQTGCSWTEALRIAHADDPVSSYYKDRNRQGWAHPRGGPGPAPACPHGLGFNCGRCYPR